MGIIGDWKKAMRNTPPERLAKIEYQSHFLQILGISLVSVILIIRGFWFIIFAFIFALGISYSQGTSAYIKYHNIMALIKPESVRDYEKDISFTRRRGKIINHVFGSSAKWVAIIMAVIAAAGVLGFDRSPLINSLTYPITLGVFYTFFYYFGLYYPAKVQYNNEIKVNEK